MFFNLDGSWEIYDSEYETLEEGEESGAAIDGYAITLTAMDGEELKLKLSEEGNQITGYEGMTCPSGGRRIRTGERKQEKEEDLS